MNKPSFSISDLDQCPLGFVAVISPNDDMSALNTLEQVLPEIKHKCYYSKSVPGMALAYRTDHLSINSLSLKGYDAVLLGSMVSEIVSYDKTPNWAVSEIINKKYGELKTLQGVFAMVVLDWQNKTISVVSDLLGIRPFYFSTYRGCIVLSDRAEAVPRLGNAKIDTMGMAGWVFFGKPVANRTIFDSVKRIEPASVSVFNANSIHIEKFWFPSISDEKISHEDLEEGIYQDFINSLNRLLQPYSRGTVLLSGGFDSRLCLLSTLNQTNIFLDAVSVPYNSAERKIVNQLTQMTGIECHYVSLIGSIWDEFDSMWYRHPDGYVRWRNLSFLCAKRYRTSRLFIDGSHSDVSLRHSRGGPADDRELTLSEAHDYVWSVSTHYNLENLFKLSFTNPMEKIARAALEEQGDAIGWSPKFCKLWNIHADERRNIAYNYLQYDHLVPSIQPFYDRALMERRLKHPNSMFTKTSYHNMLGHRFPGPGKLPHSDDLEQSVKNNYLFCRTLWKNVPSVIDFIIRNRKLFKLNHLSPRILEYSLGLKRHMYIILELMRFVKLEEELKRYNIELDLKRIFS